MWVEKPVRSWRRFVICTLDVGEPDALFSRRDVITQHDMVNFLYLETANTQVEQTLPID